METLWIASSALVFEPDLDIDAVLHDLAVLDDEEVEPEFRDLMHIRTDGNPFVLEEMLKLPREQRPRVVIVSALASTIR